MKILFLLGSGVSLESNCPDIDTLTNYVLSLSNKTCFDNQYDVDKTKQAVINHLGILANEVSRIGKKANYEDLFSMCLQLERWEYSRLRDPALTRFRDHVLRETGANLELIDKNHEELNHLAIRHIEYIVRRAVSEIRDPKGLDLITDVIEDYGPENVDIISLNHDKLVEQLLDHKQITWTNGFDKSKNNEREIAYFDDEAFSNSDNVRIVKLHGSYDWRYLGEEINENTKLWRWCEGGDSDFPNSKVGQPLEHNPFLSGILTGTTTKSEHYTRGLHGVLYLVARNLLRDHNRIICSGYGWRDEGFNWMLREWAIHKLNQRLILLHNESRKDDFIGINKKPFFWPQDWDQNSTEGWLRGHKNWLSETSLSDIQDLF